MTTSDIHQIPLDLIDVPADRTRDYDEATAEALASIIKAQGLMHPIRLRPTGTRYALIAGMHRLGAFRINGEASIPATFSGAVTDAEARLEEVMENLGRGELIALDRCHHLYELKVIHDAAHPDASKPGRRANGKTFPIYDDAEVFGLASTVAEKVGLSKRAINMAVKIWTDLTPASRLRLVGTDLARKQTELKALSEQKPAMQAKILALIESTDHPDVQNVASALAFLERGAEVSAAERQFRAINTAFARLADDALDMVVQNNADRMIASLKRLGRI